MQILGPNPNQLNQKWNRSPRRCPHTTLPLRSAANDTHAKKPQEMEDGIWGRGVLPQTCPAGVSFQVALSELEWLPPFHTDHKKHLLPADL